LSRLVRLKKNIFSWTSYRILLGMKHSFNKLIFELTPLPPSLAKEGVVQTGYKDLTPGTEKKIVESIKCQPDLYSHPLFFKREGRGESPRSSVGPASRFYQDYKGLLTK
jgi:hypothetical protein